jgi:hypothetical protein
MYANQHDYDNAAEPDLSDYRDSRKFAKFVEYVALELLSGRDCCGISSKIIMVELELNNAGFALAREIVSSDVTERQYREWLDD